MGIFSNVFGGLSFLIWGGFQMKGERGVVDFSIFRKKIRIVLFPFGLYFSRRNIFREDES